MKKVEVSVTREREYDVAVIGGGIAGVTAAIAAARNGTKTVLIEESGVLGGQATLGIVTPLDARKDLKGKPFGGILTEISEELISLGKQYGSGGDEAKIMPIASPHLLKYLLLKKCLESGVVVLFHSVFFGAEKQGNEISSVLILTKNGVERIVAKTFIDASGDGALIEKSGAPFTLGCERESYAVLQEAGLNVLHESSEKSVDYSDKKAMQPVSIFFTLGGVDVEKAYTYNNKNFKIGDLEITKEKLAKWKFYGTCGFEENGDKMPLPQGRILVTHGTRKDVAVVNMSRVTGINGADADSLNEGEYKAQLQVIAIVDFLKTFVDGFENCYLIQSGNTLGIRETRRLKGETVLNGLNVINGNRTAYPVARGSYIIDIHDPSGRGKAIGGNIKGDFYDIPYGALITKNVPNLLAVGRCISADHVAHSSTRIQGTCMLTGQAAGVAAAISVVSGVQACDLSEKLVHERLLVEGVYLD